MEIKDKCNIDGKKLRINTFSGQESVLFEDISSLGYKRVAIEENSSNYLIGGFLLGIGIGGFIFGWIVISWKISFVLSLIVIVVGKILMKKTLFYFDSISVETRGGKIINYAVEDTLGQKEIDRIEEAKRLPNT